DLNNLMQHLAPPPRRIATVFCTASTRFCIDTPTPTPTAKRQVQTTSSGVTRSSVESTPKPATRIPVPVTICHLILPLRLTSCPETVDETNVPTIIGIMRSPASVGL